MAISFPSVSVPALMLVAAIPARALTPPPSLSCVPAKAMVTAQALGAVMAGQGDYLLRRCAAKDLVARGAQGVPVAVGLLDSSDSTSVILALTVLAEMGPQARASLPALMAKIRNPPAALERNEAYLYAAVTALGQAAVPAIPLLITQTGDARYSHYAAHALGSVGKYDVQQVLPALIAMLNRRTEETAVLNALRAFGTAGRVALPATLASLERAKVSGDSTHGAAAVRALASIAAPAESVAVLTGLLGHPVLSGAAIDALAVLGKAAQDAVPALITKLNKSRKLHHVPENIVRALVAIAPGSPLVQRQLLIDATKHKNEWALYIIGNVITLPPDFAPALAAALARNPGDPALAKALERTRARR